MCLKQEVAVNQGGTDSEQLAAFVCDTTPDALPAYVVDDARDRLRDTLGVCLAGSRMDYAAAVRSVADTLGGRPESTTVGFGQRLPATLAGFVNGALAHGPDYDDTHSVAMVHISCVVVPAALAMGERVRASGADMMSALVLGAEVGLRLAAAAPHRFHMRGLHTTSICGPFAAAAVAARLLGLDRTRTANALGLAGSQSAGLLQGLRDGSWVKRLHPGWATQSGLLAALLAEQGFTGPAEVVEGGAGLYAALLHGEDGPAYAARVCTGLGEEWLLPATTYKPYPNGAWNHSSMDAVAALMRDNGLRHADVAAIECHVPPECIPIVCEPRETKIHPRSPYHMKFSLPYSVAMLAVLGRVEVDDYTEDVRTDPRVADLASRVACIADASMAPTDFPARVILRTRDGRAFEQVVAHQRGGPGNPMSREAHERKFRANALPSLGVEGTDALLVAIEGVWQAPDVTELARLLAAHA